MDLIVLIDQIMKQSGAQPIPDPAASTTIRLLKSHVLSGFSAEPLPRITDVIFRNIKLPTMFPDGDEALWRLLSPLAWAL